MAVTVRKVTLWRTEVENKPGTLAELLRPLAEAGANLNVVMGYRIPGEPARAAIEIFPVSGKRSMTAAEKAGLSRSSIPTLLAVGDDRPGIGSAIAEAIAGAGMNLTFMVAQVIGRRYSGVFGFDSEEDARKAATLIKKASRRPKR